MTSRENGFATATLELLSGYPGHFYHGSDGSFICGVDDTYGLPIRLLATVAMTTSGSGAITVRFRRMLSNTDCLGIHD